MEGVSEHAPARVVLVDDQQFIRLGLRQVLRREAGIEVVGEAINGHDAVELCLRLQPDLVLMDVQMPEMDGLPGTSVLILTALDTTESLLEAVRAGAAGYVVKESVFANVAGAVHRVLAGESPIDGQLAMQLLRRLSSETHAERDGRYEEQRARREEVSASLTNREMEILGLVGLGLTNAQIANNLFLSVGTVKTHVHRILSKLGVSDRTQAAVLAVELRLTPDTA